MKKAIAILLALTLCLGLAACGGTFPWNDAHPAVSDWNALP